MSDPLLSVTVVLCRPRDPGNIGSTCRAMKSMGIRRLRIVGRAPADLRLARVLAVHALDVLDAAERFDSLPDAVRGEALVVGVSRREGKWRKQIRLSPEELADRMAAHPAAPVSLVFGNEESGLSDEELDPCHLVVSIPSSPLFPSLNLSHAVQIVCYALFRRLGRSAPPANGPGRLAMASAEEIEAATEALMAALREAGFFTQGREAEMRLLHRDLLARATPSGAEAQRVLRCFSIQRALIAGIRKSAPD